MSKDPSDYDSESISPQRGGGIKRRERLLPPPHLHFVAVLERAKAVAGRTA